MSDNLCFSVFYDFWRTQIILSILFLLLNFSLKFVVQTKDSREINDFGVKFRISI